MVRRFAVAMVMLAALAVLAVAGVHNMRARRQAMQQAQNAQITITKDDPGASAGANLKGHAAPAFTLASLDGRKVSLADYKGKPVVLNFWATWCAPCKLEMPWLQEFSAKYQAQGLQVVGIADDQDAPKEDVAKAVQRVGVTYPILLTDGKVTPQYGGVEYLPETFYIDRNGTVQIENSGAPSKDEMEANIRKLLAMGAN